MIGSLYQSSKQHCYLGYDNSSKRFALQLIIISYKVSYNIRMTGSRNLKMDIVPIVILKLAYSHSNHMILYRWHK